MYLLVYVPVHVSVCMLTLTYLCTWGGGCSQKKAPAYSVLELHVCV